MKTETWVILGIAGWFLYDTWQKSQQVATATGNTGPVDPLGQSCITADGKSGTYQRAWDGTLLCVPDNFGAL